MKLSILFFALSSLMSVHSFASPTFIERQQGRCDLAAQHSQQKALGDCYSAKYLSCEILSSNDIANLGYDRCEYETTVVGNNLDQDLNSNRIFRGNMAGGSCGRVQNESAANALYDCRLNMRYCTPILTVTLSDNGRDFCQVYSLVRGSN